jgi:hypothetical protein
VSQQNAVNQSNAAAPAQEPEVTPESIIDQLRALRVKIPNYVQLPVSEAKKMHVIAHLNPQLALAAIQAVGASARVEATVGRSAEELLVAREMAARWTAVRDELKATLDGVSSAVLTIKHDFGQSVLLTYAVSKKLVKVREHSDLLPYVAMMRNANRLGRSRKAQSPPEVPAADPS